MNKIQKRTKIVATLGPASSDKTILTNMIAKGVDVCRLNFSHGSQDDHLKVIQTIQEINNEHPFNVGILAKLQRPKITIVIMKDDDAILITGSKVEITTKEHICDEKHIYITYVNFPNDIKDNEIILLDDSKLQLRVLSKN